MIVSDPRVTTRRELAAATRQPEFPQNAQVTPVFTRGSVAVIRAIIDTESSAPASSISVTDKNSI